MTATTDIATFGAGRRTPGERGRSRIGLTLLLSLFLVYSFAPLVYLILSATKTNGDLFTTFGFGFGTNFCLGASLARYELGLLFGRLTRELTNLRVIDPPDIEANIFVGAVRSLTMAFDRR